MGSCDVAIFGDDDLPLFFCSAAPETLHVSATGFVPVATSTGLNAYSSGSGPGLATGPVNGDVDIAWLAPRPDHNSNII